MVAPPRTDLVENKVKPVLPNELLMGIFKMAHESSPSSIVPAMATSKLWHSVIEPMVYSTIHLNRDTVDQLSECIRPFDNDSEESISPLELQSHQRKSRAFRHTTKLVIDDIPLMYRDIYHQSVQRFCNSVRLPNATTIIWAHDHARIWLDSTDVGLGTYRLPKPVPISVLASHAWAFSRVVSAPRKRVCIQISPEMDDDREIATPAIGGAYRRSTGDKRYILRTIDRINEFLESLSGKIDLHVHQPVSDMFLALASTPATYSFTGVADRVTLKSHIIDNFKTYLMDSNTLPFQTNRHRGREFFEILYESLADLSSEEVPERMKKKRAKALVDEYLRRLYPHHIPGVSFGGVVRGVLEDFEQLLSALAGTHEVDCGSCRWRGLETEV